MTNHLIRYFDMFAGIGGFRAGLTRAGGFQCVGHCEIDKYADASYRAIHDIGKEEVYYPDAREIDPGEMPDFELLCGGFPCQSWSAAGNRLGFADPRGTLFFEIARLAETRKPAYLLLENVPRLLQHDQGQAFATILTTLHDLGYGLEWNVCDSADHQVPQSRRRLFLVGYLDPRCAGKIFPLPGNDGKALIQLIGGPQGYRVYDIEGTACTQTAGSGGTGAKTGLYLIPPEAAFVDLAVGEPRRTDTARCLTARYGQTTLSNHRAERSGVLLIREPTKRGYKEAVPGDSVDLGYPGSKTRGGRVSKLAHDAASVQGIVDQGGRIRRLMPRECLRLQGFAEDQIDRLLTITSDAQAYKQAGNSVTVNVIEAIGRRIRAVDERLRKEDAA
jgi:DNA (cytosine-5)-methyltransferase 1